MNQIFVLILVTSTAVVDAQRTLEVLVRPGSGRTRSLSTTESSARGRALNRNALSSSDLNRNAIHNTEYSDDAYRRRLPEAATLGRTLPPLIPRGTRQEPGRRTGSLPSGTRGFTPRPLPGQGRQGQTGGEDLLYDNEFSQQDDIKEDGGQTGIGRRTYGQRPGVLGLGGQLPAGYHPAGSIPGRYPQPGTNYPGHSGTLPGQYPQTGGHNPSTTYPGQYPQQGVTGNIPGQFQQQGGAYNPVQFPQQGGAYYPGQVPQQGYNPGQLPQQGVGHNPGGYNPQTGGGIPGGYLPGGYPRPGGYPATGGHTGTHNPGGQATGGYAPGGCTPGGYAPGGLAAGGHTPGGHSPGGYVPVSGHTGSSGGSYTPAGYGPKDYDNLQPGGLGSLSSGHSQMGHSSQGYGLNSPQGMHGQLSPHLGQGIQSGFGSAGSYGISPSADLAGLSYDDGVVSRPVTLGGFQGFNQPRGLGTGQGVGTSAISPRRSAPFQ